MIKVIFFQVKKTRCAVQVICFSKNWDTNIDHLQLMIDNLKMSGYADRFMNELLLPMVKQVMPLCKKLY